MFLDLTRQTGKFVIFLGIIGFTIAWAFKLQNNFAYTTNINGESMIVFDMYKYATNLSNTWVSLPFDFNGLLPTRTWDYGGNIANWDPYFNNLALLFDYMYMPINFILWIIRWLAWVMKLIMALIGWDFTMKAQTTPLGVVEYVYGSVLLQTLQWVIDNLFIPYI